LLATLNQIRTEFWSDPERHRPYRLDLFGSRRTILAQFLTHIGVDDADQALAQEMAHHFTETQLGTITAFPGAIEAVRELRVRGLKQAGAAHQWRSA
jgi:hypothetical protein